MRTQPHQPQPDRAGTTLSGYILLAPVDRQYQAHHLAHVVRSDTTHVRVYGRKYRDGLHGHIHASKIAAVFSSDAWAAAQLAGGLRAESCSTGSCPHHDTHESAWSWHASRHRGKSNPGPGGITHYETLTLRVAQDIPDPQYRSIFNQPALLISVGWICTNSGSCNGKVFPPKVRGPDYWLSGGLVSVRLCC